MKSQSPLQHLRAGTRLDKGSAQNAGLSDLIAVYRTLSRAKDLHSTLAAANLRLKEHVVRWDHLENVLADSLSCVSRLMDLIEELIDIDHLRGASAAEQRVEVGAGALAKLFRDSTVRVHPKFSPRLNHLYEDIQRTEVGMGEEYCRVVGSPALRGSKQSGGDLPTSGSRASCVHLELSSVYGPHFRVTKRHSACLFRDLSKGGIPKSDTSNGNTNMQQPSYTLLSTQKAGVLFTTPRLNLFSSQYQCLTQEYRDVQKEVVNKAVEVAATYSTALIRLADCVGEVDCLVSLALAATEHSWTIPSLCESGARKLSIKGLRHPCVEMTVGSCSYTASDIKLSDDMYVAIITGPNMGGKSTILRAVGICVLLAQMGSAVPAAEARISVIDKLLVRVGAGDSAELSVSTFMAEMLDVNSILQRATMNSLVILDELGRGTSTQDGFGIAWAVIRELATHVKCLTLVATHFHELRLIVEDNAVADAHSNPHFSRNHTVRSSANFHVAAHICSESGVVSMLYRLNRGPSTCSYGIRLAALTGFPASVVREAADIEQSLWSERHFHILSSQDAAPQIKSKRWSSLSVETNEGTEATKRICNRDL